MCNSIYWLNKQSQQSHWSICPWGTSGTWQGPETHRGTGDQGRQERHMCRFLNSRAIKSVQYCAIYTLLEQSRTIPLLHNPVRFPSTSTSSWERIVLVSQCDVTNTKCTPDADPPPCLSAGFGVNKHFAGQFRIRHLTQQEGEFPISLSLSFPFALFLSLKVLIFIHFYFQEFWWLLRVAG